MHDEYISSNSSKINFLSCGKKNVTVSTIISDFDQKINPLPYKLDQYKQFIDKTEQVLIFILTFIIKKNLNYTNIEVYKFD
jgi:uncharacterized protein (DUF1499 family)